MNILTEFSFFPQAIYLSDELIIPGSLSANSSNKAENYGDLWDLSRQKDTLPTDYGLVLISEQK